MRKILTNTSQILTLTRLSQVHLNYKTKRTSCQFSPKHKTPVFVENVDRSLNIEICLLQSLVEEQKINFLTL